MVHLNSSPKQNLPRSAKKNSRLGYVVAQLGPRMHYAIPKMLNDAGLLAELHVDGVSNKFPYKVLRAAPAWALPKNLIRARDRWIENIPSTQIYSQAALGWAYARARARCKHDGDVASIYLRYSEQFCRNTVRSIRSSNVSCYTFNTCGLEILADSRFASGVKVVEQTIAPRVIEERILNEARERFPDWERPRATPPAILELGRREVEEWKLADKIVCGSDFVRNSVQSAHGLGSKCVVVPYGVDGSSFDQTREAFTYKANRKLRVLTVGAVGLRKGYPVLLKAAKLLKTQCEFRAVGVILTPPKVTSEIGQFVELTGAIPRSVLSMHYAWADVFLLPSFCEGSATVTYEAMLSGLPIICTPNTGSIVVNGVNGYIVPAFDAERIVQTIVELASRPELLNNMEQSALSSRAQCTFDAYKSRLLPVLA